MGKCSAVWSDALAEKFVDLCVKEVEKGNRPNAHLSKDGWLNVVTALNTEFKLNYTKVQCKNKWDALKEGWKLWKDLLGKETGLGWDATLQTVTASEEWWSGKIKENKEYGKLRKKGISPAQEEKLDTLFKGISATGIHAYIPGATISLSESPIHVDDYVEVEQSSDDAVQAPKRRKKSEPVGKGKEAGTKQGKVGGAALIGQKIDRMCDVIEMRRKSAAAIDPTSIEVVMKVVQALPGCEQGTRLFFFATRLFLQKEKREMFCTMEGDDMKLQYLKFEHEN